MATKKKGRAARKAATVQTVNTLSIPIDELLDLLRREYKLPADLTAVQVEAEVLCLDANGEQIETCCEKTIVGTLKVVWTAEGVA